MFLQLAPDSEFSPVLHIGLWRGSIAGPRSPCTAKSNQQMHPQVLMQHLSNTHERLSFAGRALKDERQALGMIECGWMFGAC